MNNHRSHAYESPVLHTECVYQDVQTSTPRQYNKHGGGGRISTKKKVSDFSTPSVTGHNRLSASQIWHSDLRASCSTYENVCDLCGFDACDEQNICDRCQRTVAAEQPIDSSQWNDHRSNHDKLVQNTVDLYEESLFGEADRYQDVIESEQLNEWNENRYCFDQYVSKNRLTLNRLSDHFSDRTNTGSIDQFIQNRSDQFLDRSEQNLSTINRIDVDEPIENIYENICDKCGLIFSGDQCSACSARNQKRKSDPEKRSQLNIFTGFIDSFKQKTRIKERSSGKSKRKLEIVHNVDNVFKTNKSFDMNEICRLRSQLKATESDRNGVVINERNNNNSSRSSSNRNTNKSTNNSIYGKLRHSDEYLLSRGNKNIIPPDGSVIKSSASESNFTQSTPSAFPVLGQQQQFASDLIDHQSYYNNSPIYENLENHNESTCTTQSTITVQPFRLYWQRYPYQRPFNDITTIARSSYASVFEWMTSLRTHTDTYDPDQWHSVKCIPSRTFDCASCNYCYYSNGGGGGRLYYSSSMLAGQQKLVQLSKYRGDSLMKSQIIIENDGDNDGEITMMNESGIECSRVIERFKVANQAKRKAIYLKDEKHLEPMFVILKGNLTDLCDDLARNSNRNSAHLDADHPIDALDLNEDSVQSILRPKNKHFKNYLILDEDVEPQTQMESDDLEVKSIVEIKKSIDRSKSQWITQRKTFLIQVIMSTSLNRIIITYDRKLKTFLNNINLKKFNKNDLEKIFRNAHHYCGKQKQCTKYQLTDFEMPYSMVHAKDLTDFEFRNNSGNSSCSGKRLEDFEKHEPSTQLLKMLSDFEWKQKKRNVPLPPQPPPAGPIIRPPVPIRKHAEDSIYQPIWNFQTLGYAREPDSADDDGMDGDGHGDGYYDAGNYYEAIDLHEWEVAEEFSYATELREEICDESEMQLNRNNETFHDPYQSVCILFNVDNPKYNQFIYQCKQSCDVNQNTAVHINEEIGTRKVKANGTNAFVNRSDVFKSVQAWQRMLMSVNYMEDEEDVNVIIDDFLSTKTFESVSYTTETIPSKQTTDNPWKEDNFLDKQSGSSSQTGSDQLIINKKELGFLSKLQSGRIDISKASFWPNSDENKSKNASETFFQLNFDSGEPPIITKKSIGHQIYGVTLDELEKDEQFPAIPKFVVECIRIIEEEENIQTNGIYRASGKKESIDKIKKKMDEKWKKGSKYSILKTEDVHTITGALKQFFRELKTELIPIQLVRNLPNDLELEDNFNAIVHEMNKIDENTMKTLQFLLEHLRRVDQNNEHNLMTASNLSIVWGACLFTSSVTSADLFETTELIKKNMLVKILIQRYREIFSVDSRNR